MAANRSKWFEKALYVDTLRGRDSTGMACIPEDTSEPVVIYKKAMPAHDFLDMRITRELISSMQDHWCVIGHNRSATTGGMSAESAHPFQQGDITLVHNGTMDFWVGLDKKFDVDSEAICYAISTTPVKEVLETIEGAFALVWHNAGDDTIHFARNDERPFHFAFSKDNETLLFASEDWMISELAPLALDIGKVFSLVKGKHVTFSRDLKDLSKYSVEDFTPTDPYKTYSQYGGGKYDWYTPVKKPQSKSKAMIPTKQKFIGGSGDALKDSLQRLESLGYIVGERVVFIPEYFTSYSGTGDIGTLRGEVAKNYGADKIISYGTYEYFNDANFLLAGKVTGSIMDGKEVTIVLTDVVYTYDENKKEVNVVDGRGKTITEGEFVKLAQYGCVLCQANIDPYDSPYIEFTDDGYPFCMDCSDDLEKACANGKV